VAYLDENTQPLLRSQDRPRCHQSGADDGRPVSDPVSEC
jgi:hypothetical protein